MNLSTGCPSVYFDGAKLAIKNIPRNFFYSHFLVLSYYFFYCRFCLMALPPLLHLSVAGCGVNGAAAYRICERGCLTK